jgi:mycothiol synthase
MELVWRAVSLDDAGDLSRLDRAIKRADGAQTVSDLVGDVLSAEAAVCACNSSGAIIGVGYVNGATIGGGVDPDYRRRGVGSRLIGWAEEHAPAGGELTIRNEALTADAHALYLSHGFECRMLETRMVREVAYAAPAAPLSDGVKMLSWNGDTAPLFFAAYRRSFADRPGFPDPPVQQLIGEHDGEAFEPSVSHVAVAAGAPVGFVSVELALPHGWIDQIGVAPEWRRRGLGAVLLTSALRHLQAMAVVDVRLHVNNDNPGAKALFEVIGFQEDLQRARYVKQDRRRADNTRFTGWH